MLIGFMGAGKSTVGRLLADRLGLPFFDTDDLVEARAGRSIADLFEAEGEGAFRTLERDVALELLQRPGDFVIALGGGAVTDPVTAAKLEWSEVVYLNTPYTEAMRRTGADPGRPLLRAADPKALFEQRRPIYESRARLTVKTSDREPAEIASELAEKLRPNVTPSAVRRVAVTTSSAAYEVVIGAGILDRLRDLPVLAEAEAAMVITHTEIEPIAMRVVDALKECGLRVEMERIPAGEKTKTVETVAHLYASMAGAGLHRRDVVFAVGGGVVGDVAGFAAATYHRGMPVVHIPTTLLAQVDAAIGGKTGVNLPQGKNLVGAIHQPAAVLCDVRLLDSLPEPEFRSGLAEVVKYGFISDPSMFELLSDREVNDLMGDPQHLVEIVTRSVRVKALIVSSDEREEGLREILNYGHTFGHAIEHSIGYERIRHGEAISIGMTCAAYLARIMGRIEDDVVDLHRTTLSHLGLPVQASLDLPALEEAWSHDKKYRHGLRFVLLAGLGRAEPGIRPPKEAIEMAIKEVAA